MTGQACLYKDPDAGSRPERIYRVIERGSH